MTDPAWAAVLGYGLWMPGYRDLDAWRSRTFDGAATAPVGLALDRINRRRAGVLGRAIADAASQAFGAAEVDPSTMPCVVGSSIGEAAAMIGILDQIWRTKTPVSPATFTVSVHNASSGLLSISCKNQGYVTSLAADEDTPAMALIEGMGLVDDMEIPVLVACGDEAAPSELVKEEPHWGMLAGAVVLGPADAAGASSAGPQIRVRHGGEATLARADLSVASAASPQAGMVDLIDAILRGEPGCVPLDRGTGRGYLAELRFGS